MKTHKPYLLIQRIGALSEKKRRLNVLIKLKPGEKARFIDPAGEFPPKPPSPDIKENARVFWIKITKEGMDENTCPVHLQSSPLDSSKPEERFVHVKIEGTIGGSPDEGGVGNYDDPDGPEDTE